MPEESNLPDAPTQTFVGTAPFGEKLGSMVGPYRLLSVLGEGGFGTVYLADQEKPIRRRVALKIIKAGMDTRQVLARFEAERQALAMMDHPNIAKVFDAGSTESGRSYFAMEVVHGEPITDYCDRHKLTLEERLELFIPVCQAVQHAHQKGIIHRDLKPKNVLVAVTDDRPAPKIIDFGVAKAMAQPLTQQTIFTEQGQLIGTPEYMSPEQAEMSNLDIDTRSDIYSLGVLLYELLTGALPFDRQTLRMAGFDEIRRMIREVEPSKPSTKISTLGEDSQDLAAKRGIDLRCLRRRLRQELDWIVMKTLEKDRTRRYATAVALAEDIQHYLQHEPVQAGPPRSWYRIRKYARRYRMPLCIATGFVALLVAITILAVSGYYRESQLRSDADIARQEEEIACQQEAKLRTETEIARHQAEQETEKAKANFKMARDAVKKYYTQVADDPRLKLHNLEELRRDLLESANEFYEKLIRQEADDLDLQHERVWAFVARGQIEMALGNSSDAETAYKKAIAAATRLTQIYGTEPKYQDDLAASHRNLGIFYQSIGRTEEAEAAYKERVACWKILVEKHPDVPDYQNGLACSHDDLGSFYQAAGRAKEAEATYEEALAIQKTLVKKHPEAPEYQNTLACTHGCLGLLYQAAGRAKEAEATHKEALAIRKILVEKHPGDPMYQNNLACSHSDLGGLYQAAGRAKEAEAAYKEAIALLKPLAEQHPEDPMYPCNLASGHDSLGNLYQAAGRAKEAEAAYKEALAILKLLAEEHPEVPEYQHKLANSHNELGTFYQAAGRAKEAEVAYKEALAIRKLLVEKHPEAIEYRESLADNYITLGLLYRATGRAKEAEAANKEARALWKTLAEKHPEVPEYQKRRAADKEQDSLAEKYHAKKVAQNSAKASWSPDGEKIVFGKMPYGAGLQILAFKAEKVIDLLDSGKDPAWSPGDGKWIAFVKGTIDWNSTEVWLVEASGKNPRRIAEGGWPSWSSDGKTLYFRSNVQQKILATQPDKKEAHITEVCNMPWCYFPGISPDGKQISYTDGDNLKILNRDTQKTTFSIALPQKGAIWHSWSQDSKRILFGGSTEQQGPGYGLWTLNLETNVFRKVLSGPCFTSAWSPDGSRIAFDLRDDWRNEIWVIETKNLDRPK